MRKGYRVTALLLASLVLFIAASAAVYADDGRLALSLPISVSVNGPPDAPSPPNVLFELSSSEGTPMPVGTEDGVYRFMVVGAGETELVIEYSEVGIWHYVLTAESSLGAVEPERLEINVQTFMEEGCLKAFVWATDEEGMKCGLDFTVTVTPDVPHTGGANAYLHRYLIAAGLLLLTAALFVSGKRRARKEE